ncbi:MAG: GHKL domain-containing protein, partial [Deltaproteobacteria bacterium]|nr:GHKL domain-containing protein [Deltaproteobacteria bacterium]
YKNQEQERLFGPLPDDHTFFDCDNVHPDDTKKVQSFYRDIISETVHTRDVEFRFYPLGKLQSAPDMRWVICRGSTIEYQGKKALFINMMDITRFMELEQLVRVQDKMASLGRVAAGIAHEIRNPLTGITTYLYSLQTFAGNISEQDREHMAGILQEMMNASTKIEAVIKRVMDFSRPGMPKFSVVEINSVIQDAVNLSTATLRKNDIMLTTDLCPDLPHCQADYHMIEQVLMNLIANAIQAFSGTGSQKLIKITSAPAESSVIIRISDTGPGIPPGEREKVFDPFYTTKSDGSGIGLSLCQRIITDHGGSLSITSSTWDGAEFILELPLKQALSRPRANPGVIFPEP